MSRKVILLLAAILILSFSAAASAERSGKAVYESVCSICHASGAMGSPQFGAAVWKKLAKNGIDALVESAVKGTGAMPAKGTCSDCSEAELKAAVQYMIDSAK